MEPARPLPPAHDEEENLSWAESNLEAWRKVKSRDKVKKFEESDSVWLVSYADLMTVLVGFFALLLSFSVPEPKKLEEVKKVVAQEFGGKVEKPYEALEQEIKRIITEQKMDQQISVDTDAEGVIITFRDAVFFDTGSFNVKPVASELLERLIAGIRDQSKEFDVLVEGHTDNVPMKGDQLTNWELSGLRAARVVRSFEQNGFDPHRLQGIGFGETRPIADNQDANGVAIPENQGKNRRVVVKLVKKFGKGGVAIKMSAPSRQPSAAVPATVTPQPLPQEAQAAPPVETPAARPQPPQEAAPQAPAPQAPAAH